jgi:hypothetical protein
MVVMYDKFSDEKKAELRNKAKIYIERLTSSTKRSG